MHWMEVMSRSGIQMEVAKIQPTHLQQSSEI